MEKKGDIRKSVLEKRNQINKKEWEEKSQAIYSKVITHPFFLKTEILYSYVDYKQEVGTKALIEKAWQLGKRVAVPKIMGDEMQFFYIQQFSELEEGYKGILEPTTSELADTTDGLVIMPGVAFDKDRNRIGYGKGFYDKFLSNHKELNTLAICFSCQMIDCIPADEFDIRPQVLITEEMTYAYESTK